VATPEIVLVDSGSTDATVAIASRFPVRVVQIKPSEFTFGRSLNRGIEATHGDLVVLASAHVYPRYDDWMSQLTAPFGDPDVALAYGKQRGDEVTKYSEHQIFRSWFPDESNPNQTTPFCNNANAAIRRAAWATMPYDETLTGLEDIDWARRALARGKRLAYVAEAEVAHVHEETSSRIYNRYRREAMALKNIFPEEQFGLRDFARLFPKNVVSDLAAAWKDAASVGTVGEKLGGIVLFRALQFWGTYRGFAQRGAVDDRLRRRLYYPRDSEARPQADRRQQPIDYGQVTTADRADRS
ncbi:MAG: glycosyltransferase, partial [Deltaproteobacteria bacterium]|nr:glycosyltransferase [Deltaproteobacteria bacterium]